jgi:hypothetical protein
MDPVVKEKWVAALRSDKYKQGFGRLHKADDTYCALGVLCDVYSKEFDVPWDKTEYHEGDNFSPFLGLINSLPKDVCKWAGLRSNVVSIRHNTLSVNIVLLNDEYKLTFNQLANYIEEQL